jgi:L-threonylcarbamoyladenylate synthase
MLIDLDRALSILQNEEIVALPTETVYGLAGDATSEKAIRRIYQAKGRPSFNPLIIHVSSLEQAKEYAEFNEASSLLANEFWPGPLTLVLKGKDSNIANIATANLSTIAIRVPASNEMISLINSLGKPLAAPSANISSKISPTRAEHVNKSFKGTVPIIDAGKSIYGLESTIIDCSSEDNIKILRHGFITKEILENFLGQELSEENNVESIKAPGMLQKHYSPSCALRINASKAEHDEVVLNFGGSNLIGKKSYNLSTAGDLIEAAANLYHFMQFAEDAVRLESLKGIAIAKIPNTGIGIAINDKLTRASI